MYTLTKYEKELEKIILDGDTLHLSLLLHRGLSPNAKVNRYGLTVLSCAVLNERNDMVEMLIDYEADVYLADEHGMTALSFAAERGNMEATELIAHASTDTERNFDFFTDALGYAVINSQAEVVKYLLDLGADPTRGVNGFKNALEEAALYFTDNGGEILEILLMYCRDNEIDIGEIMGKILNFPTQTFKFNGKEENTRDHFTSLFAKYGWEVGITPRTLNR